MEKNNAIKLLEYFVRQQNRKVEIKTELRLAKKEVYQNFLKEKLHDQLYKARTAKMRLLKELRRLMELEINNTEE